VDGFAVAPAAELGRVAIMTTMEMEITTDGDQVHKVRFIKAGQHFTAPPTFALVHADELGGYRVHWQGGSAGPFPTPAFAQAVAEALRSETT
jgi:hypothetical protein